MTRSHHDSPWAASQVANWSGARTPSSSEVKKFIEDKYAGSVLAAYLGLAGGVVGVWSTMRA
ncbi:hypothetical protein [Micromonospora sp. CPCC 206061]|uniref:hypothetical protein n=1 Tax=Micromonospora sp. CPCC 206061 TaxID=3122410 RepID=UPI002FF036C1